MSNYPVTLKKLCFFFTIVCICLVGSSSVFASNTFGDIVVSVESYPTGQTNHGYAEYKVYVTNNSVTETHKVKLLTPYRSYGNQDHISRITREIELGPTSSSSVSIFQPPLNMRGEGLGVIIDGRTQREHVSLNTSNHCINSGLTRYSGSRSYIDLPSCLLLSQRLNLDDFQNEVHKAFSGPPSGTGSSPISRSISLTHSFNIIKSESPVLAWSNNWLAYSSYDGIVVSASDMLAMPSAVRSAILQYVQSGGSLIVLGRWDKPQEWMSNEDKLGQLSYNYLGYGICIVSETENFKSWPVQYWEWLISQAWRPTALEFKNQISNDANRRFPIVSNLTIPVRGMFLLVLLFVIVIGPLNIFVLSRKKKRIWLLWTVPVISILASLVVFFYATFGEGWHGYIRTQSLTILNEETHTATTIALNGFYYPVTPRDGLHFESETEVTPIGLLPGQSGGRARTVDWSNDQHLSSGWISARLTAHFMLRKNEIRRERLNFSKSDNKITVLNGLGADIKQLWYADEDRKIYTTDKITAAGAKVTLAERHLSVASQYQENIWRQLFQSDWSHYTDAMVSNPARYLKANSYIAVLDESLFVEEAIENTKYKDFVSVVFGITKGTEGAG